MAIRLTCPNGHSLAVAEQHAGKRVMCPKCQAVSVVPAARGAPPPLPAGAFAPAPSDQIQAGQPPRDEYGDVTFEEDDRPRKRRPRRGDDYEDGFEDEDRPRKKSGGLKRRQRMKLVNLGLGLHYAGLVIVLVGLFVSFVLPFLVLSGLGGVVLIDVLLIDALNILLTIAVGLVTPGLWIAGSILCLYVPQKSGGYPLILTALILDGVAIILLLALWWLLGPLVMLVCLILLAAWILFMLFLRALARYLREHGCADEAMQLLVFGIGLMVGTVVFFLILFVLAVPLHAPPLLMMLLFLGGGIAILVLEIKFLLRNLGLIGSLRQTIATRD